jgi:hypothetical protein
VSRTYCTEPVEVAADEGLSSAGDAEQGAVHAASSRKISGMGINEARDTPGKYGPVGIIIYLIACTPGPANKNSGNGLPSRKEGLCGLETTAIPARPSAMF